VGICICKDKQRVYGNPHTKTQLWLYEDGETIGEERTVLELQKISARVTLLSIEW